MNVGMLWFDNDPSSELEDKISRAAGYYEKKYGMTPDLCFVHPSMLKNKTLPSSSIQIKTDRSILPNHFWIGIQNVAFALK